MEQGARAVIIEKPIVTTSADLDLLCTAVEKYGTPVFAAFQKRYSRFNDYLAEDLRVRPGEPVSCFAVAYEVPLPPRHWYRWPNSGSSIISNGCHWIDHFLYLNNYSSVRQVAAEPLGEASLLVRMILENEAALSLSLTHEGSPRLGVREHCEFRANGVTATVADAKNYVSESARGVIRKARMHRFSAYRAMYRSMCAAIATDAGGDSLRSLRQSGHAVLVAEECLAKAAVRDEEQVRPASRAGAWP
jgi:predicted dehydrogenase